MAGFVMRDPRLNKYGIRKEVFNRDKHHEALYADKEGQGWYASTTPLKISAARITWLRNQGLITTIAKGGRLDGVAEHPSGIRFNYSLIADIGNPMLFGVYVNHNPKPGEWKQERSPTDNVNYHPNFGQQYESLLAMTNPPAHRSYPAGNYLNAITGDYDLFAVWPFVRDYDASAYGADHRPLGTVKGSLTKAEKDNIEHLERNFTTGGQGTKLGNITPRIYMICQLINSIIAKQQVLWHSDEAARPFLDDVDLPVIAFTPAGNFFGIETIFDFKVFIAYCEQAGIKVTLSNAWAQNVSGDKTNRLGAEFARFVPPDGERIIVPAWYNL